jgi:calcineurin-like phosphoesterase family protein
MNKKERIIMRPISKFTKRFLFNTKVRDGDFDWHLYDMSYEFSDEEEALRQLNCLIESIITGNDTYSLENFKTDVEEAQREVEEL